MTAALVGAVTCKDLAAVFRRVNPAWAHAALRAVVNPVCQPWPVPQGGWPEGSFILVFDAKDVF
ncbi:hypothetical protein [Inquilinus sp. CA228]|uniref:hypothetical protein n=1 Tax=Inquilinus sp. CA228 TaxID=3455609 RepID=UPI003F8D3172